MAFFPQATWKGPVPNRTPGGMGKVLGVVLHIQEGTESGTNAWFHNTAAKASAHFGNPKTGPLEQWVDTSDAAWAQSEGNPHWVSVEHEGHSGDELTPSQLENDARLMVWLNFTYGVPLQVSDSPGVAGLGWHGMGGTAWGGHFDCPGEPIKNARPAIVARAFQILTPPKSALEDEDMWTIVAVEGQGQNWAVNGANKFRIYDQIETSTGQALGYFRPGAVQSINQYSLDRMVEIATVPPNDVVPSQPYPTKP